MGPTRYGRGMNTPTVEIPLGHIVLASEIMSYMAERHIPVSHIRSGLSLATHPAGGPPERYKIEVLSLIHI